ncbi:MAG: putative thiosulfate sulfurtransferase [Pelotomaculum sp. PtaB.Bin104]|nr:MAG: putative thiosulfate sulfurtransferase [Pelotomaculum sp. PtaB.Bin104]
MNKKNKVFILYCLVILLVIAVTMSILAGCRKSSSSLQEDPASLAEKKITQYSNPEAVISVSELNNTLNDSNLVILDARYANARAIRESNDGQIPGAISILRSHYQDPARWNSVAPPNYIQRYFREIGIDNYSKIVIYGNDNGLQGRLYWMLKMYGIDNEIKILDGGFEKWKEADYQSASPKTKRSPSSFEFNTIKADENMKTNLKDIGEILASNNPNNIIVDARNNNEFSSGHIPSSVNISVDDILNEDKTFKTAKELDAIFTQKGVTPDKNVFVYCHDGSRSSLTWYVLHELMGYPNVKNYDGGFKEWKYRERPIEKGAPNTVTPA